MLSFNKNLIVITSISLLFGCLSLNNDDKNDNKTEDKPIAKTSLSGKVADGYLTGAKVCLDLNKNKVCDDGEPSTKSSAGGEFSLEGVTQAQLDSAPILVEVIVGETIDEDTPNKTIDKKYTLSAPAGYAFVSPLTTMVQSEIEDKKITPEAAKGAIQAKLGTTLDLEADYVSGSSSGDNATEFKRLHKVAQVTTVVLQNNIKLVEEILTGTDTKFEDLIGLIVNKVLDSLDTISTQVNAAGSDFDPTKVAESDTIKTANIDTATVKEDIAEREADRNTVATNIATLFGSGASIHSFRSENRDSIQSYEYETIKKTAENIVTFLKHKFNKDTKLWVADTESGTTNNDNRREICILENGGFQCSKDDKESVTIENNAVIVKKANSEKTRTEITGVSVDLTGKSIQTFLDKDFDRVTNPTAVFTTGATGYKLSFNRTQNMHALFKANVEKVTDCWQDHDQAREIKTGQPFNPTDNWCNNVFIRTGDGNHTTDGVAAKTIADLISATAAASPTRVENIKGTSIHGRNLELMAEFVTGGIANYYVIQHEKDKPSTIKNKVAGSWKQETIEGQALLLYTLPPVLSELGNIESDQRSGFFSVKDGFLRRGGIQPAGIDAKSEWVMNDAARDQILGAFDYALKTDLIACKSGDKDFDPENTKDKPGATTAEFATAATGCSSVAFTATELTGTTLATGFGFLNFKTATTGVFVGEVGSNPNAVLVFNWSINSSGHVVINAQAAEGDKTIHLRLSLAKITRNTRQISLVTFGQEAATAAEVSSAKGDIKGNVWGIK